MAPTCSRCTCGGVGRCDPCQEIKAAVAREATPPAERTALGPARTT